MVSKNIFILLSIFGLFLTSRTGVLAQEADEEEPVFFPTPARPSDLRQETRDEGTETDEEEPVVEEEYSEGSLTDYDNLIYTAFVIPEESIDAFLEYVENNDNAQGQFELSELDSEEYEGQAFLATYTPEASADKQPILFSAHTQFETEEEAEEFGENTLTIYPDLFFDYEVYEVEGFYDVLFGIRVHVDTTVIWYESDENTIEYNATRSDFIYELEEGEDDPYQDAVLEAFPGQFEFESEESEDGIIQVTMSHINSPYEENMDESEESDESDINGEESEVASSGESLSMTEEDDENSDISNEEGSLEGTDIGNPITAQLSGFKDNIMSFLNDRNITSDNALIYLMGGFILLFGLLLIVVGKR